MCSLLSRAVQIREALFYVHTSLPVSQRQVIETLGIEVTVTFKINFFSLNKNCSLEVFFKILNTLKHIFSFAVKQQL